MNKSLSTHNKKIQLFENNVIDKYNIFDCENLNKLFDNIVLIIPTSGSSGALFLVCKYKPPGAKSSISFFTKLQFYKHQPYRLKIENQEIVSYDSDYSRCKNVSDVELEILILLRENILKPKISPCIVELIYSKICTNIFSHLPENDLCDAIWSEPIITPKKQIIAEFCKIRVQYRAGLAEDKCIFYVLERCTDTLLNFFTNIIDEDNSSLKYQISEIFCSFLFMLLFTLWAINSLFPSFRHKDLHSNNIMVRKFDSKIKRDITLYNSFSTSPDNTFYVPYIGLIPVIIDFESSEFPEQNIISDHWIYEKLSPHIDLKHDYLRLFNSFYWIGRRLKIEFIDKLLERLIPNRTYINLYKPHITEHRSELPTYEQLINNDVFAPYREKQPDKLIVNKYGFTKK